MEAVAHAFENLAMRVSDWKFSHWCLSLKEKSLQRVLQYPVRYLVPRKVWGGGERTDYKEVFCHLFLLGKHVENIALNESEWAVHVFGKIYFKDGFNWQAYHYLKNNESHMKPNIFSKLLSVNS